MQKLKREIRDELDRLMQDFKRRGRHVETLPPASAEHSHTVQQSYTSVVVETMGNRYVITRRYNPERYEREV